MGQNKCLPPCVPSGRGGKEAVNEKMKTFPFFLHDFTEEVLRMSFLREQDQLVLRL